MIHPGAVLGGRGFRVKTDEDGNRYRLPSLGGVHVSDGAEVGANTTIDAASEEGDVTYIGPGAHISNLVAVGHDSHIGEGTIICAGVIICGYVTTGKNVYIAPGAIIKNRVSIGDNAFIGLGSVVIDDVAEGARMVGSPARRVPFAMRK